MVHEKAEKLDVSCGHEIPREGDGWEMCLRLELPVYEVVMKRSWWVKRKEFRSLTPVYGKKNREDDSVIYCQGVDLGRTGLGYWLWYKNQYSKFDSNSAGRVRQPHVQARRQLCA